jgi:Protein of unknown function (DUF3037)
MGEFRKLEYFLLRYVPNAVREEFVNIGLVMTEAGGDGAGFAGVHFTKDWRRAMCLDPSVDVEMLEALGRDVEQRLKDVKSQAVLLHEMMDSYSNTVQLSTMQNCVAVDPERELRELARRLVEAPKIELQELAKSPRKAGRKWILEEMHREFLAAGVWNLLQKHLPASPYTNAADDFTFDFAYAVRSEVKLFHAVSLVERMKDAELFALRVAKIGPKMASMRKTTPRFTAVVEDDFDNADTDVISILAMMKAEEIRIARLREMPAIAEMARRELGA